MRDAELAGLLAAAGGPFPRSLDGDEVNGVDPHMLDMVIQAAASHYDRNSNPISDEHRAALVEALRDCDVMWPELPTDESRAYFTRARAVAAYLLEKRS
jgi:hypothetical protein